MSQITVTSVTASEARHFGLYWVLAEARYGREVTTARLERLAAKETLSLAGLLERPEDVRMHSVGVDVDLGRSIGAP